MSRLVIALVFVWGASAGAWAQLFSVTIGQNFAGSTAPLLNPPPDTMGAVGIDYFVELNNHRFRVYRKSDGAVVQSITDSQFWMNAGITPNGNSFDPRLVYDPHARRWYAVGVDNGQNPNNFLFAVSDTSDPTQSWSGFTIDSDTFDTHWADFPMLGFTGEGVYISANMVSLSGTPNPQTTFVVLPKFDLLQSTPSIANMTLIEHVPTSATGFSPQVTVDASNEFGVGMPLLSVADVVAGSLVRSDISTPGAPALGPSTTLTTFGAANPPTVDQPGPSQNIEANDARISANTVLHNGEIYAVHSIADMGLSSLHFMRIDATTNALLESSIIVDPASRALTFPSIAVNDFGDVVVGVTGTSTTEFASSYVLIGRTSGGITSFDAPLLLQAGVDEYVRLDSQGRNRWGDYSATTVDPADPSIFWTTQEFVVGTNNWSTQVTELILPRPGEARWADPVAFGMFDDATMWLTSHGATPLNNERLIFSRATDPAGPPITIFLPTQPAGIYAHEAVSFRQGNVLLDLNGNQLDLLLEMDVGTYQCHPQATIANGVVTSIAGFIAQRPTSEGHLTLDNAQWTLSGDLVIGSDVAPGSAGLLPGALGGTGSLTIDNNSRLEVGAMLRLWRQGTVNLADGTLVAPLIDSNFGKVNFTGGTLQVDTFAGELINQGGALAPGGNLIGATNVLLRYEQLSGTYAIDIAGPAPGLYDELIVGGDAVLGEVDITLVGGYMPSLGDTYEIVRASLIPVTGVASLLANTTFPNVGNRLDWHLFYDPTVITLAIVPAVTGDFNADGVVDAADYTVWRDTQGQTGIALAADADFNQQINIVDYLLWRQNFGAVAPGAGSLVSVPEPAAWLLVVGVGLTTLSRFRRRTTSSRVRNA